ncbi:hypothetical protein [Gordonia bronchialis]|uniref:hypothetical protein n=1 Tax=Gordonia bronchialis TaxID=2054 RepID=UPI00226EC4DB|nr:hypothetical protein [Gordonia bronchialis]
MPTSSTGYTELINLTPHFLTVYDGAEVVLSIPPSGSVCRIGENRAAPTNLPVNGVDIPVVDLNYTTQLSELPDPQDGVLLVVSRISAQVLSNRNDIVFPLDEVRDEQRRIVGCRALGRFRQADEKVAQ